MESMEDFIKGIHPVPTWYIVMEENRIMHVVLRKRKEIPLVDTGFEALGYKWWGNFIREKELFPMPFLTS